MQTTPVPKKSEIESKWWLIDAKDVILGRLCTHVAVRLTGKDKPRYVPFLDTGDHVVIINAAKVKFTGKKLTDKVYFRHSGYPGGLRSETAGKLMGRHPERVIMEGVKGMLPKTKLGRAMLKKLRVYAGAEHPHEAQAPVAVAVVVPKRA